MNPHWNSYLNRTLSRRDLLRASSTGFGALALAGLLGEQLNAADTTVGGAAGPLAVKAPHFGPKAKRVIFLFMQYDVGERPFAGIRQAVGRRLLHQIDLWIELAARRRAAGIAYGQRYVRAAFHWLVDHLRVGQREPEHAGLHYDLSDAEPRRSE